MNFRGLLFMKHPIDEWSLQGRLLFSVRFVVDRALLSMLLYLY